MALFKRILNRHGNQLQSVRNRKNEFDNFKLSAVSRRSRKGLPTSRVALLEIAEKSASRERLMQPVRQPSRHRLAILNAGKSVNRSASEDSEDRPPTSEQNRKSLFIEQGTAEYSQAHANKAKKAP